MVSLTGKGLVMTELNPEYSIDDVKAVTEADFTVSLQLKNME